MVGIGAPQHPFSQGLQTVGRLPLGAKAAAALAGHAADAHGGIFQAAVERHHAAPVLLAELLKTAVVGGGGGHRQQQPLAGPLALLAQQGIEIAAALRQVWSIALGQSCGAGITKQQARLHTGRHQLAGQAQRQRQQAQALKTPLHSPAAVGIGR